MGEIGRGSMRRARVSDRYRLQGVLGSGGSGVVYEAFDRERDEVVALKTLSTTSLDKLIRLKHEFRTLVDLGHPNLVALHELAEHEGTVYFTMERVEGAVPFDVWARRGEAGLRAALDQVIGGLNALHQQGIVHRDIKPSNVLVDPAGRVVIVDFGLAHHLDRDSTFAAGTPAYMAPEQYDDEVTLTPAVDAYSLGVMLFEALAGSLPFDGTVYQVAAAKLAQSHLSLGTLAPHTPPDLAELVESLLTSDPEERPDLSSLLSVERAHEDGAFVGRTQALAQLQRAFHGQRGELLEIVGPSGIGKTALLNHFVSGLQGEMVLRGRCHPREDIAYKAFDGIMDELSKRIERAPHLRRVLPRDTEALCTLFPAMRRVVSTVKVSSPAATRERGIRACRELFARLGEQVPVVLAIDDTQWGDADSATLLTELLRQPAQPNVLIVTTRRSDELGAMMSRFDQGCDAGTPLLRMVIALAPLNDDESRRLASTLTSNDSRVDEVVAHGMGHPLFIRELALRGTGASLEELLGRRIAELPANVQQTLTLISVAGYPLPPHILAKTTSTAALKVLDTAKLVRHGPAGTRVYHDRITDVVLARLDAESLRVQHSALADAWISEGRDPERVAAHLVAAGDDRAPSYLLAAARRASKGLAFRRAATLYQELLRWVERGAPVDASEIEIRETLAEVLKSAGQPRESAEAYLATARLATGQEADRLRGCAAAQVVWTGDTKWAREIFATVFRGFGQGSDRVTLKTSAQIGVNLASAFLRKRRRPLPPIPELSAQLESLWTAFGAIAVLDPAQSLVLVSKFRAEATRSSDPLDQLRAVALGLFREALLGGAAGWAERRSRLERAYAPAAGEPLATLTHHCFVVVMDALGFRPKECIETCLLGLHHAREHGLEWTFESAGLSQLMANSLEATGDVAARETFASQALAEANERNHLFQWHTSTIQLAAVARIRGDIAQSRRLMRDIQARWRGDFRSHHRGWRLAHFVGDALADGDTARAHDIALEGQDRSLRARVLDMPHMSMFDELMLARAAIALAADDRGKRRMLLRDADRVRKLYRAQPSDYCLTVALALEAGIAGARGDDTGALRALRAMLRVAEDTGCVMLLALARKKLCRFDSNTDLRRKADEFFERSGIEEVMFPARLFMPGVFRAAEL